MLHYSHSTVRNVALFTQGEQNWHWESGSRSAAQKIFYRFFLRPKNLLHCSQNTVHNVALFTQYSPCCCTVHRVQSV